MFGWFSVTAIAVVLVVVFAADAVARWYRGNEWRRRARRANKEERDNVSH